MSSKIKVDTIENVAGSGNVSLGSGHNLVVPGNITGSGTLTTTGTLTANGLSTLVGSTTHGTDAGDTRFNLNGPNQYRAVFKHAGNIAGQIGGGGADDLRFSNAAGATTMSIKDGHVTIPNQPAFMAYKNGNQSLTAHTLTKITGWTEATDQSNSWDNSAGTFTAPSAGIYLFGIIMQANVNGGLHRMVLKNGNNGIYGDNYLDGGDISGGAYTILMPMVANDYVEYLAYLTVNGNINSGRSKVWAVKVG